MIRGQGRMCVSAGFRHPGANVKVAVQQVRGRVRASCVAGDASRGCRLGSQVAQRAPLSEGSAVWKLGQPSLGSQALLMAP